MSTVLKRVLTFRPLAEPIRRLAEADGFYPGRRCFCGIAATPAIVGGDGYWLPLMCLRCRARAHRRPW